MSDDERTDRLTKAVLQSFDSASLVGSFFHQYDAEHPPGEGLHGQGCIVAEPAPGVYLVEFFSFLHGQPIHQQLIPIAAMAHWQFFDAAEWMVNTYVEYSRAADVRERRQGATP
jgi:hypothetical protein